MPNYGSRPNSRQYGIADCEVDEGGEVVVRLKYEEYLFEVLDRRGRIVRYKTSVFERHLPERPEMAGYIAEIRETVADPDKEVYDGDAIVYYRMGLGRDKFQRCYIKVPVYYQGVFGAEEGSIATAHFTTRIGGRGRIVWERHQSEKG